MPERHVKEVEVQLGLGVVGGLVGVDLAGVVGVAASQRRQPRLVHPPQGGSEGGRVRVVWANLLPYR